MLLDIAFCITNESYDKGGAELKDFRNPFQNSCYKLNVYAKKEILTVCLLFLTKARIKEQVGMCPLNKSCKMNYCVHLHIKEK